MRKRVHVYYSGMVQGVGFRYITRQVADELAVSGWVKNLSDGRVEVEAEADEDVLLYYLQRVKDYFSRYIQNADIRWLEPKGGASDFKVKFERW